MTDLLVKDNVLRSLPYLRRYARALAGTRAAGDSLVAAALAQVDMAQAVEDSEQHTIALFRRVTDAAASSVAGKTSPDGSLSLQERQILLLTSLENFPVDSAGAIMGISGGEAVQILTSAKERLRTNAQTDVLIIEDEPVIALDIAGLVASCGHRVVGVAAGEAEAVAMAREKRPGLILADINLRHGGDGQRAVAEIHKDSTVPVIFITAYPERLLTGAINEPAFLITKPFDPTRLAITTYQAVSGGLPFK